MYVWIGIVIVFSIWVPQTFPNVTTAKQILNTNAITAFAALAITIPLAARVFDLSFAYTMTLSGVITAHFIAGTRSAGYRQCFIGLAAGLLIGFDQCDRWSS